MSRLPYKIEGAIIGAPIILAIYGLAEVFKEHHYLKGAACIIVGITAFYLLIKYWK